MEKVRFWPSNYGSSLVLTLQLQNQTTVVYQLCKPDRNGPRAGATAVSAQSTRDDRGIGPSSFSRGPLTRALSSHSLPFVPQPRTLTPDGGDSMTSSSSASSWRGGGRFDRGGFWSSPFSVAEALLIIGRS